MKDFSKVSSPAGEDLVLWLRDESGEIGPHGAVPMQGVGVIAETRQALYFRARGNRAQVVVSNTGTPVFSEASYGAVWEATYVVEHEDSPQLGSVVRWTVEEDVFYTIEGEPNAARTCGEQLERPTTWELCHCAQVEHQPSIGLVNAIVRRAVEEYLLESRVHEAQAALTE